MKLKKSEVITLGLMTFALFVGAGNIIFPPFIGMQAGNNLWFAVSGFLITGVGLPVLAIIAMANKNGSLEALTAPAGKIFGLILTLICYLALGPLFGSPRTATVSYEIGVAPATHGALSLHLFSVLFFIAVVLCSLNPSKLVTIVGKYLSPIKVVLLIILGIYAFWNPASNELITTPEYVAMPFSRGMINGYLTMDTLAALVFAVIIITAIRQRGVSRSSLITRYSVITSLIAGLGLVYVYISLFYLGAHSHSLAPNATNGAVVLQSFIAYSFGYKGTVFLAVIITLACLVTGIGLTSACAGYLHQILRLNYKLLVIILAGISCAISNIGLTEVIKFSVPALTAIYPPFIVLVLIGLTKHAPKNICFPPLLVSFVLGIIQSIVPDELTPGFIKCLPFYNESMGWIIPTISMFIVTWAITTIRAKNASR
ncbi:branched-chain amino acid transport system II carrier protein [Buttiauxella noackiae]|uniref:branched-chain amino acid transport system II carrier protein n=1 Tax=Buttiauxella noackiae TaxID=82992 RepID=UPI0035A6C28B